MLQYYATAGSEAALPVAFSDEFDTFGPNIDVNDRNPKLDSDVMATEQKTELAVSATNFHIVITMSTDPCLHR